MSAEQGLLERGSYFLFAADLQASGNAHPQSLSDNPHDISIIPPGAALETAIQALQNVGIERPELTIGLPDTTSTISTMYPLSDTNGALILRAQAPFVPHNTPYDYTPVEQLVRQRCRDVGIIVPTVYATHEDLTKQPNFTFTVEEHAGHDGWRWIKEHPESAEAFIKYVAGSLVAMHAIEINTNGWGFFSPQAARTHVLQGVQPNYRTHINNSLPLSLKHLRDAKLATEAETTALGEFFRTAPFVDQIERGPKVLLHGDPGYHNSLVNDGMPTTTIDFGEAQAGPIERDLAAVYRPLAFLSVDNLWPSFLAEYQQQGGLLTENSEVAINALRLRIDIAQQAAGVTVLPRLDEVTKAKTLETLGKAQVRIRAIAAQLKIANFG